MAIDSIIMVVVTRACLGCGIPIIGARYCARCVGEGKAPATNPHGHRSLGRDRTRQARFRKSMLKLYDGRCAAIREDGLRCPRTENLEAHHGKNGEPDLLLCSLHHQEVDPWAR